MFLREIRQFEEGISAAGMLSLCLFSVLPDWMSPIGHLTPRLHLILEKRNELSSLQGFLGAGSLTKA